jgi:hypothetical protein
MKSSEKAPLGTFLAANPFPRPLTDGLFYREKMRAIHRIAPDTLGVSARSAAVLEIGGGRSGLTSSSCSIRACGIRLSCAATHARFPSAMAVSTP